MVLEDRFSSVPNIAQIGGDIICYFKAAQGVYVPEGVEEEIVKAKEANTSMFLNKNLARSIHLTPRGMSEYTDGVGVMFTLWPASLQEGNIKGITFDDGTVERKQKRTRQDYVEYDNKERRLKNDKDIRPAGEELPYEWRDGNFDKKALKGWTHGNLQTFTFPAILKNQGDLIPYTRVMYHNITKAAAYNWVFEHDNIKFHKLDPQVAAEAYIQLADAENALPTKEEKWKASGNTLEQRAGDVATFLSKVEGEKKGKEKNGVLKAGGRPTMKRTRALVKGKRKELRGAIIDDGKANLATVSPEEVIREIRTEIAEQLNPPEPTPSTSGGGGTFNDILQRQTNAAQQEEPATDVFEEATNLDDLEEEVQMDAADLATTFEKQESETTPSVPHPFVSEDFEASIRAVAEAMLPKKVAEELEKEGKMAQTMEEDRKTEAQIYEEAEQAIQKELDGMKYKYAEDIKAKDANISQLQEDFAKKAEYILEIESNVKNLQAKETKFQEERGKYESRIKSMTRTMGKSEQRIKDMVQKPKPVREDGMGIHSALSMIGSGVTAMSAGDYTSNESMAAIMALVFLFGVAMIGMNYAKGGAKISQ